MAADHRTKRQKIEDLLRGAKTDGERRAAQAALDRLPPDPGPRPGYAPPPPNDWSSQHQAEEVFRRAKEYSRTYRTTWSINAEPRPTEGDNVEWDADHIFTAEDFERYKRAFEEMSRQTGGTARSFNDYARTSEDLTEQLRRAQGRERITRDYGATFINMSPNMDPETVDRLVRDYTTGKIGIDELRQRMRGDG